MNDHGHAWDARYSKSESKSETIGTVFSEKEIHNATIDAIVLELEPLFNSYIEVRNENSKLDTTIGEQVAQMSHNKADVIKFILDKIKSMKQG